MGGDLGFIGLSHVFAFAHFFELDIASRLNSQAFFCLQTKLLWNVQLFSKSCINLRQKICI